MKKILQRDVRYYIESAIGFSALIIIAVLNIIYTSNIDWRLLIFWKVLLVSVSINILIHVVYWVRKCKRLKAEEGGSKLKKPDIRRIIIVSASAFICLTIISIFGVINRNFMSGIQDAMKGNTYVYEDEHVSLIIRDDEENGEPILSCKNKDSNEVIDYSIEFGYSSLYKMPMCELESIGKDKKEHMLITTRKYFGGSIELGMFFTSDKCLFHLRDESLLLEPIEVSD